MVYSLYCGCKLHLMVWPKRDSSVFSRDDDIVVKIDVMSVLYTRDSTLSGTIDTLIFGSANSLAINRSMLRCEICGAS
jgi:hypothetical protein